MLELDSDVLVSMTDEQIRAFADEQLSIVFMVGTPRDVMLTKIVNASLVIPDVIDRPSWVTLH